MIGDLGVAGCGDAQTRQLDDLVMALPDDRMTGEAAGAAEPAG
jgi:hypothetical protein